MLYSNLLSRIQGWTQHTETVMGPLSLHSIMHISNCLSVIIEKFKYSFKCVLTLVHFFNVFYAFSSYFEEHQHLTDPLGMQFRHDVLLLLWDVRYGHGTFFISKVSFSPISFICTYQLCTSFKTCLISLHYVQLNGIQISLYLEISWLW